jgi:phosphoribosylformimino-5-aminoimidazole carboxamide ribotide isomerase
MFMLLIPGLELRNGVIAYPNPKVDAEDPLIYLDPRETVQRLVDAGATRIHLIDADGASHTEPYNTGVVEALHKRFPQLQIEVTGGIRKREHAEMWLDVGASFVIVGWKMLRNPDTTVELCAEYPNRIIVSLEGNSGRVQTGPDTYADAIQLARRYSEEGVNQIFYTELHAPGERTDPLPAAAAVANEIDIPVICNGGVHDLDAVTRLKKTPLAKLGGVVIGRALLNGGLDYATVLRTLK